MTRFLPIFLLFFVLSSLFIVVSVSAQEITPSVTPVTQIYPQALPWEDFLQNLIPAQFKKIPDTLEQINRSNLPYDVYDTGPSARSDISIQAASNTTENKEIVAKAAGEYTIGTGIQTPLAISQASTNIFLDFFASIANAFASIFDRGEKQAKNYAGTVLPEDVKEQNFAQGAENISGFASENSNVLGTQTGQTAMDRALPLIQCGELPFGLCGSDNKPNFAQ